MTIPFLNLFKKATAAKQTSAPTRPAAKGGMEKPSGTRLSKTVLPNSVRTIAPQEEFDPTPAPVQSRVYSLGGKKQQPQLPPAVAVALEPKVERVISLGLQDVVGRMPAGWVRPLSDTEGSRRVLLKAAEVEKGMSSGQPSVSLTSIYNQVPEIFVRPVPPSDQAQVPLPFNKVMEQFSNVQIRNDQSRDQTVPQLETPFLKVTLEDNSRFGTTMAPIQISDKPFVKMELATAEAIAAAQPELFAKPAPPPPAPPGPAVPQLPVTRAKDGNGPVIKLPVEEQHNEEPRPEETEPEAEVAPVATPGPTRIPFNISPIGTGAPASERVPASSGPSVPTSEPARARIPFKMTPSESLATPTPKAPTTLPNESKKKPVADGGIMLTLALKPILAALPPFQLSGDIKDLPDDARVEVPFSLVQPQLSSGRVSIKAEDFSALLPAEYQNFFSAAELNVPVVLPLQDVLKNLPSASLRMRDDQEQQEEGANFQTPFSTKAAEDAKRFGPAKEPKPLKGLPQHLPPTRAEGASEKPAAPKESPKKIRTALQMALETDEELDAKAVVARLEKISGIDACAFMFADGLSLAGNLPSELQADGLCAMAPSFLQRLSEHLAPSKLGELHAMTLSCGKAAVTFFMHDNLCLAALHAQKELSAEVRERLARIVHELAKKYSQPA